MEDLITLPVSIVRELVWKSRSTPTQILFFLDSFQIFRHILKADVTQILIIFDSVENRAPNWHFP